MIFGEGAKSCPNPMPSLCARRVVRVVKLHNKHSEIQRSWQCQTDKLRLGIRYYKRISREGKMEFLDQFTESGG